MLRAECGWPTPVILATQEAEIRRVAVQSQPRQIVYRTLSQKKKKKKKSQKGLVEWFKVKALSSSPSSAKTKNKCCVTPP
jgi:hypothetical protein